MKSTVIYPGTFDPLTNGHVDIIERAAKLFSRVLVACAPSGHKQPYLTWEERISLVTQTLDGLDNVSVWPLEGLLIEFAKKHDATVILRGLRTVADFDYELQFAYMNYRLAPKMETLFLPAREESRYLSATLVREIIELGGDVSPFVPVAVARYLEQKGGTD